MEPQSGDTIAKGFDMKINNLVSQWLYVAPLEL
jgi:hypothetical protein